jgi:hypothetical protein
MAYGILTPRFPLGRIVATSRAMALGIDLMPFIRRHHGADWGDELCPDDREANDRALREGSRILSCYRTAGSQRIYIITEWDRSQTTVMLPDEY